MNMKPEDFAILSMVIIIIIAIILISIIFTDRKPSIISKFIGYVCLIISAFLGFEFILAYLSGAGPYNMVGWIMPLLFVSLAGSAWFLLFEK